MMYNGAMTSFVTTTKHKDELQHDLEQQQIGGTEWGGYVNKSVTFDRRSMGMPESLAKPLEKSQSQRTVNTGGSVQSPCKI